MKVYCPCESKCRGFSGTARKCTRVGTSSVMPQQFVEARADRRSGVLGGLASILFDSLTPVAAERGGVRVTYETWQCPACRCEVLVAVTKSATETKSAKADELPRC